MKSIAQDERAVNEKVKREKEGKMKRLLVAMMLAVVVFVGAKDAFAYWDAPGVEVQDPAPNPFFNVGLK